jgi:DNA-binding beta-propeller fold protein YncE
MSSMPGKRTVLERISTTLTPQAPEGSTPDALEIDAAKKLLFVANADNNAIGVINIADPRRSEVLGFIRSGWYPSALALADRGRTLYVGNSKGQASYLTSKVRAALWRPTGRVTKRSRLYRRAVWRCSRWMISAKSSKQ